MVGSLFQAFRWWVACSRHSDSGERREEYGNGAENGKRKKAGKWTDSLVPLSPVSPRFFFRSLSPVRAFSHYLNVWDMLFLALTGEYCHISHQQGYWSDDSQSFLNLRLLASQMARDPCQSRFPAPIKQLEC